MPDLNPTQSCVEDSSYPKPKTVLDLLFHPLEHLFGLGRGGTDAYAGGGNASQ